MCYQNVLRKMCYPKCRKENVFGMSPGSPPGPFAEGAWTESLGGTRWAGIPQTGRCVRPSLGQGRCSQHASLREESGDALNVPRHPRNWSIPHRPTDLETKAWRRPSVAEKSRARSRAKPGSRSRISPPTKGHTSCSRPYKGHRRIWLDDFVFTTLS